MKNYKIEIVPIMLGIILMATLGFGLAFIATKLADLGFDNQEAISKLSNGTYSTEAVENHIKTENLKYFPQWNIRALIISFATFGFGIGGFITAKLSKQRPLFNSGIAGLVAGLFSLSIFASILVFGSLAGAQTQILKKADNDI